MTTALDAYMWVSKIKFVLFRLEKNCLEHIPFTLTHPSFRNVSGNINEPDIPISHFRLKAIAS
jgi:hypothetical protein